MDNYSIEAYPKIKLKPSFLYVMLHYIPAFLVILLFIYIGSEARFEGHQFFCSLALMISLITVIGIISLRSTSYIISSEQIIIHQGAFNRTSHYIELYRVVDYEQKQNFLQLLCGLKTVTILSRDRTNSCLRMVGIKAGCDIVGEIRRRVEFNKRRKGIYEITN